MPKRVTQMMHGWGFFPYKSLISGELNHKIQMITNSLQNKHKINVFYTSNIVSAKSLNVASLTEHLAFQ